MVGSVHESGLTAERKTKRLLERRGNGRRFRRERGVGVIGRLELAFIRNGKARGFFLRRRRVRPLKIVKDFIQKFIIFNRRIAVVDQKIPTLKIRFSCKEIRLDRGFVTKIDGIRHSRSPVNQA